MGNLLCSSSHDQYVIDRLVLDVKHLGRMLSECLKELESIKVSVSSDRGRVNSRPSDSKKESI